MEGVLPAGDPFSASWLFSLHRTIILDVESFTELKGCCAASDGLREKGKLTIEIHEQCS